MHGIRAPPHALQVNMKAKAGELVLADKETEAKIMAIVSAEPKQTKGAAMCSQFLSTNIARVRAEEEDGGCSPTGPPFTLPTGRGWDTSTEPKNQADMKVLAKKLNPAVGFWGARSSGDASPLSHTCM